MAAKEHFFKKGLGLKILKCRSEKGISRKALACVVGVSETSIVKWENGTANIKLFHFFHLCEFLEIDCKILFRDLKYENSKKNSCSNKPDKKQYSTSL